jgi:hypothetical protein
LAWIAWLLCGLTVALVIGAIVFAVLNSPASSGALIDFSVFFAASVGFAGVGALIVTRHAANRVAWIMIGGALTWALVQFLEQYAVYGFVTRPDSLPVPQVLLGLRMMIAGIAPALHLILLPLYFPTGQLPSPRWRHLVRLTVGAIVLFTLSWAVSKQTLTVYYGSAVLANPLSIERLGGLEGMVEIGGFFLLVALVAAAVMSLALRFYRSGGIERQQIKWLAYAFSFVPLALLAEGVYGSVDGIRVFICFLQYFVLIGIPLAIGFAILRYRLYDIDIIINRTLVYAPLSGILAGLFGGLTALFQWLSVQLMGAQSIAAIVLSAFTVFGAIIPLRDSLQALVDRHFKVAPSPGERGPVSAAGKQAVVPRSMDAGMEQDGTPAYIEQLREELAGLHADLASRSASEQELRQLLARLEERISSPPQDAITTSREQPRSADPQESAPHSHTEPGQRTLAK